MIVLGVGDEGFMDERDLLFEEAEIRVEVSEEGETMMPDLIRLEIFRSECVHQREFFEEV